MLAITTSNLCKQYKQHQVVKNVNMDIEEGELIALLGVNGAGKTTMIKMLSCIIKPTTGDAKILGASICKEPFKVKEHINVSPQETAIAPNLTVYENLEFICAIYGIPKHDTKDKINSMLKKLQLEEVTFQKAQTLSGGMQRRLSIAMALISEPKILFLDEPTLGLDIIVRRELWKLIEGLKKDMTIILTTHYLEEAQYLSDRVFMMNRGELVASGSVEDLMKQTHTTSFEDTFLEFTKGR